MNNYLKDLSVYEDRYDLGTIERCLRVIDFWKNKVKDNYFKGQNEQAEGEVRQLGAKVELYFIQGERFRERESAIKDWMEHDRRLDETFVKAQSPQNIRCGNCLEPMKVMSKDLWDRMGQTLRVMFLFECPRCQKRKAIFDDGQEYVPKSQLCPKCNKEIKTVFKEEGDIEIWERSCVACGFMERDVENLKEKKTQQVGERLKDEELLKKYRTEYCLTAKDGIEFELTVNLMEDCYKNNQKTKQREADPDYPKVEKLKRLGVVDLEKLLSKELKKQKYIKLSFGKPAIDKHVIVPFTIQDADSTRKERDSEYKLRRLIKKILEGTNWRLMSEGVSYRLGYLSGRFKGIEKEEDLLEAVKST